ncbi:MAG: hypothetical protein U0R71_12040 [Solirubrobacterales bacterium]
MAPAWSPPPTPRSPASSTDTSTRSSGSRSRPSRRCATASWRGSAAAAACSGCGGADPGPGEGEPARLRQEGDRLLLRGIKTFCSGAGGVDAALVAVGNDEGEPPRLALVECERLELDRGWFRAAGLRASESHRVRFDDAPVLGLLGGPGQLAAEPWFARDAMRTAACWAGMVDAASAAALAELRARPEDPVAHLAAGRIEAAAATVDAWFRRGAELAAAGAAAAAGDTDDAPARRSLGGLGGDAGGDRARRQSAAGERRCELPPLRRRRPPRPGPARLETFLLQHRLEPLLARLGAGRLAGP